MRMRTWGVVVVLAMGLVVAGCSSGAAGPSGEAATFGGELSALRTDYEQQLVAVQQLGREALEGGGSPAAEGGGVLDVYARMLDVTRGSRDAYAQLSPPEDLAAVHGRLVELLDGQADALERVISSASAQDDTALTEALQQLAVLMGEWGSTNQALQRELDSTA